MAISNIWKIENKRIVLLHVRNLNEQKKKKESIHQQPNAVMFKW